MNYNVIASGSSGNAVVINDNILIDCGVPFKELQPYLKDVKYLFITHIHSDHLRIKTFEQIRKRYRHIEVYGNYEVAQEVGAGNVTRILNSNKVYGIGDYKMIAFECVHNVLTYGFVFKIDKLNIIYATDTANLDNAPKMIKYDYLFLESNHDEKNEKKYIFDDSHHYDVYSAMVRHLSTQKCKYFYYTYRRDKESVLIELHKSKRFY